MKGDWFSLYYDYARHGESPEAFNLWTALSSVSSVLRRNVWLDQGRFVLYPNQYVILIGPPGKVAKGTALDIGKSLLRQVEGLQFIPDSITREDLIRHLARAGSKKREKSAVVTILSNELASLVEPSGLMMISFLTDIYDGHFKWDYSTKSKGQDLIYQPLVNILAATTPSWMATGFPVEAIGHGFTRRTVFVYADEPGALYPFPPSLDSEKEARLVKGLQDMGELSGPMEIDPRGREAYTEIYHEIYETTAPDHRIEGFHWMKKNHVLKVAMALAASDLRLTITSEDILRGWKLIGMVEKDMTKAFSAVGRYEHATDLERIMNEISKNGGMSEEQIYRRNYASGDIQDIAKIIQMLKAMGRIKTIKTAGGQTMIHPVEG
jgi:hypothetical protein